MNSFKNLTYHERLQTLQLTTLEIVRGDVIEL